ncbi:MAG: hypothetical protein ABL886_08745, partial [Rhodoglobus sp.]
GMRVGRRRGRHVEARPSSRRWVFIGGAAAVVLAVGILFSVPSTFASAGSTPTPTPTAATQLDRATASGPEKVVAATPAPVHNTVESPLGMDDPYPDFVPDQCPEGTTAGAVDVNGNQSNCQAVTPAPTP